MPTLKTTRAPFVVDRLLWLLENRTDSETTQVLDGPTVSGDYKDVVYLVGYRPDQPNDVTVTRTGPGGLVHNDKESFTLGVLINAVDGTGVVKAARDKAAAALAVLEDILTTRDPDLGLGDGVKVRLAEHVWRAIPTTKGVEQTVACVLAGEALL